MGFSQGLPAACDIYSRTSITAVGLQALQEQRFDKATTMSLRGPVKTLTARREAPSLMGRVGRVGRVGRTVPESVL